MLWMILVCLLGSNDFTTRERANRALAANIDTAAAAIAAGEYSDDAEIAERCRVMMNAWWRKHADRMVDSHKPFNGWPWLEHCDDIPWEVFHDYMAKARIAYPMPSGEFDWPQHQIATRLLIRDMLAERLPVEPILRTLWERHRDYCTTHNLPFVLKD